jgi:hypothetical protein
MGGRIVLDLSRGAYTTTATAIKEYVSNGWDAGAASIQIRVYNADQPDKMTVEILDDGCGMTRRELDDKFFRIGRDRRKEEGAVVTTIRGRRLVHGRKGLGKLAGLKLADVLEVLSWTNAKTLQGARVDLKEIQEHPNEAPVVHWFTPTAPPVPDSRHGTLVRLVDYNRANRINLEELAWSLCLWFEFGSDVKVELQQVDGFREQFTTKKTWRIARSEAFKKLKVKKESALVKWRENGREVSKPIKIRWSWLGKSKTNVRSMISVFSGTRALSTEESFDIQRGWTNMFGIYKLVAEFRADWLDQLIDLDPADIKREGINWELHPSLESLRELGQEWVKRTCTRMAKSKSGRTDIREKTERLVKSRPEFRAWRPAQRERLISLVTGYASQAALSTDELDSLIGMFAFLLQHDALIRFVQSLRDSGKKDVEGFLEFARDFSATEIVGILQVARNKLAVVKRLETLIADPKTRELPTKGQSDITTFLAESPWIFDPELRISHVNHTMKRIVLETEGFSAAEINRLPSEYFKIRPDFVGYVGPSGKPVCIELKKPTHKMEKVEAQRVMDYRAALLPEFAGLEVIVVSGTFSAAAKSLLDSVNADMLPYLDLFNRAKNQLKDFIEKLESGLSAIGDGNEVAEKPRKRTKRTKRETSSA